MADLLKAQDIKEWLKKIPEWELDKKHIERTFEFDDFTQAIEFVNGVAEIADEEDHHPDIDVRYNKVRIALSTHSEGGLTEVDFEYVLLPAERFMKAVGVTTMPDTYRRHFGEL